MIEAHIQFLILGEKFFKLLICERLPVIAENAFEELVAFEGFLVGGLLLWFWLGLHPRVDTLLICQLVY